MSCPCQPFSAAGQGAGFDDERHLWPAAQWLIEQCKPPAVFGEQVASKGADSWIDLVHDDVEAMGYAFGAVPFPSAGVGAPHIRDRLYWVGLADPDSERLEGRGILRERADKCTTRTDGVVDGMADEQGRPAGSQHGGGSSWWSDADWLPCRDGKLRPVEPGAFPLAHGAPARVGRLRAYGNAINAEAARVFILATGLLDDTGNNG